MSRDLLEYADPDIGGIGHLLKATYPTVYLPHAMVGVHPCFDPQVGDRYLADHIHGFPIPLQMHRNQDAPLLMPVTGSPAPAIAASRSEFDHDGEVTTPYWYRVLLERYDIDVEYTVTEHGVVYRFRWSEGTEPLLLLRTEGAVIEFASDTAAVGSQVLDARVQGHFAWETDLPATAREACADGCRLGYAGSTVEMRIGVSLIDREQARRNLDRELMGHSFEQLKMAARAQWTRELGKLRVEGGTEKQRRTLYTALYRYMGRMQCISEDGRYRSGYDGRVHAGEADFYVADQMWDTFRSAHPLRLLLDPRRQLDMIRSYVRMYEQSGWLPRFPGPTGDRPCMLGHHTVATIADAYVKGLRDYDVEAAYAGIRKSIVEATRLPWRNGPLTELDQVYMREGFFPALRPGEEETCDAVHPFEARQSVAVSLEWCYDEWCLAQMARALGKGEDSERFTARAANYRKSYHPATGFMEPRSADGAWIEGFDPKLSGGQGGRDYFAECNAWTFTWSVQHDVAGLIELMGGREAFADRLDQLFVEPCAGTKYHFQGQFPDSTGLMGQFVTGNEPSFHIPYLYAYAGAPWQTQRRIRQIMDIWFGDGPLGICGDEDGGAMSAWHVFNSIGFFPVCPGAPHYVMGSPVFERVEMDLGEGRTLELTAEGSSARNKYIQRATLNGADHSRPWFEHAAIADGGVLALVMGDRPNRDWGSRPEDAPPSMSGRT